MGHPLQRDLPDVVEAIDRTITAGRKHDVPVGVSAGYVGGVEAAIDKGCQLIKLGNDVGAVRDVLAGELRKGIDKTDRSPNR
jgi:2-keto-3-deoxy-L-rhamnonate aldolase RhmA